MRKWTPGPWKVIAEERAVSRWIIGTEAEDSVADCSPMTPWLKPDVADANARLIAAAPDMYAVLDELEGAFDTEIFPEQSKEGFDALDGREYSVTITAKQWRALSRALQKAGA
jgi:hypothetical protein